MRRFSFPLVLSMLVGLTGCREGTQGNPAPPALEWSNGLQALADGNNQFGLDLFAKLGVQEKGNVFFSPYSAHAALAMTATGARGVTRDQMVKVLRLPADEQEAAAAGDLGRFYAQPRKEYELSVANGVWGQKGYPWRPEFLELQKTRFGAGFIEADFKSNPDVERGRINRWVEEKTHDRIKELIAKGLITTDHRMVLANAIYFKGKWEDPFDLKRTFPRPFTLADGTKSQVPMMYRKGGFRHYMQPRPGLPREPEFQVAELPYKGGELSMVVLLPGKHDGLPALEAKLTAEALAGWLAKADDAKEMHIYLPKFRLETESMMLKEPLQQLGMTAAFDRNAADFTGLRSSKEQLYVDFVVQKAFVDVNEEGTEAAAATAVDMAANTSKEFARLDFRADHPFLFLIRDTRHGTILFMGRFQQP